MAAASEMLTGGGCCQTRLSTGPSTHSIAVMAVMNIKGSISIVCIIYGWGLKQEGKAKNPNALSTYLGFAASHFKRTVAVQGMLCRC
jgi:hypothetical protein